MKSVNSLLLAAGYTLLAALLSAQSSEPLPKIESENLNGHAVVLPAASAGKVALLVLGFTKASKQQTSEWAKAVSKDLAGQKDFDLYQMPVLEDVPRIVRGMVISSIRKGVPENQRDHFLIVLHGENDLKHLVHYKEEDDAYLVVVDRAGNIALQKHGGVSAGSSAEIETKIHALLTPPH